MRRAYPQSSVFSYRLGHGRRRKQYHMRMQLLARSTSGRMLPGLVIETRPERPLLLTSSTSASTCSSKVPTQVARSSLPCLENLPPALNDDKMPMLCDPPRCSSTHSTLSAPIWVPARHTRHVLRTSSILLRYLFMFQCLLLAARKLPSPYFSGVRLFLHQHTET